MKHPITIYREQHQLTLEQAGAQFGISKPSMWRIEAGEQMPSPSLAKTIADKTGIPLWKLRPDIWDQPKDGEAA